MAAPAKAHIKPLELTDEQIRKAKSYVAKFIRRNPWLERHREDMQQEALLGMCSSCSRSYGAIVDWLRREYGGRKGIDSQRHMPLSLEGDEAAGYLAPVIAVADDGLGQFWSDLGKLVKAEYLVTARSYYEGGKSLNELAAEESRSYDHLLYELRVFRKAVKRYIDQADVCSK